MALRIPLCIFNRHAPLRKRVKWDGLHFIGQCRMCGRAIRKHENGSWRKDWLEGTQTAGRIAKLPSPTIASGDEDHAI